MAELDQRQKDLEEEQFLQELRELAGMDGPVPQPQPAPQPQPQLQPAPAPQPAPQRLLTPQPATEEQSAPLRRPKEEPARQGSGQTRRVELRGAEQSAERQRPQRSSTAALPQLPKGVPGWIPGLLILLAALAVLALTALGVWRGLHM